MDFKAFCEYAQKGNLVPVYRERLADLETPVSVLSRFVNDERVFLLESVEGGERFGRYSFLGVGATAVFTVENKIAYVTDAAGKRQVGEGVAALRQQFADIRAVEVPGVPPLFGGAIGFLSYESVNEFEKLPDPKSPLATPEAAFLLVDQMIIFDNVRHTVKLLICVHTDDFADLRSAYRDAQQKLDALEAKLREAPPAIPEVTESTPRFVGNLTREEFCAMVDRAKAQIVAGEIIQVVLSQRFSAPLVAPPLQLYRALRLINPSPYTFFLKNGDHILIGSSPETMVKLENGVSSLRPIAGTRRRGATLARDRELADELLADPKERAEHLMLVDLGRNDLGRVAKPGSVQVKRFMQLERYSHVMHLVSDVEAELASGADALDLVRSTFPAGTLSGAPKVRAMEIIHELEPAPRGAYGGAVGYLSYTGNLDLAITIRTLEIKGDTLSVQAGAGIVFDSVPEKEYEETLNKAAALFEAVKLAGNNLSIKEN